MAWLAGIGSAVAAPSVTKRRFSPGGILAALPKSEKR
jgi:hypothetical protein